MIRFLLFLIITGAVATLAWTIDRQSRVPIQAAPCAAPHTIFATGRVEGATEDVRLRFQLSGRIASIPTREGQQVQPGDVLLQLDDQQHKHEVALASAELAFAQAQLQRLLAGAQREQRTEAAALYRAKQAQREQVELTWKRVRELRKTNVISAQEADDQRMQLAVLTAETDAYRARQEQLEAPAQEDDVRVQQARVDAARAKLAMAKLQLERTRLCAPQRGQILKIEGSCGELAGPLTGEPTVVMADTSRLRVRGFVEETDAPRLRVGSLVQVTAEGLPGKGFSGRIAAVSPRMDRKQLWSDQPAERFDTKTRQIWIDLARSEELVVGLRVDAAIDLQSQPSLPTEAPMVLAPAPGPETVHVAHSTPEPPQPTAAETASAVRAPFNRSMVGSVFLPSGWIEESGGASQGKPNATTPTAAMAAPKLSPSPKQVSQP